MVDTGISSTGAHDLDGNELILDADADTSITADTDDQIDIKIAGADDFQFTANTFTAQSGSTIAAQALTATTVTASGIVKTDDTTAATSTTDGSLQTDGGLSVAADAVIGDDLKLLSDSAVLSFGADSDTTLTHTDGTGLTLNSTNKLLFRDSALSISSSTDGQLDIDADTEVEIATTTLDLNGALDVSGASQFSGAITVGVDDTGLDVQFFGASAGAYALWDQSADLLDIRGATAAGAGLLKLTTGELTVVDADKLGRIDFQAPLESSGTDAILVGASIWAEADDTFAAGVNNTDLVFALGKSEAAAEKFRFTADTEIGIAGANYGTDGQVLTSGGAGAAVAWENAAASAADDISAGDGAVNLTTSSGNITIDAAANNSDIIFKGTDATSDITMLTLDGSEAGAATFNNKVVATELDISGAMDIDGTSNLDAVDIDGAVQIDATFTSGVDGQGYDTKFFGDTSSAYMLWDTSADDLVFAGAAGIDLAGDIDVDGTANLDVVDIDGAVQIDGTVTVGVDDTGLDVKFFGASAGAYMEWDQSEDQLRIMGASADATTSTGKLLLATSLTDINANDVIGKIEFQAPHEAGGTDAIAVAASIQALAQDTFSSSVNATDLIFYTGHSEAATEKFRFTSQGELGVGGANYGTDGQILTSTGAGTAPAWEDAAAGGISTGVAIAMAIVFG